MGSEKVNISRMSPLPPNTSKHLRILEDAGLVQSHKDGLWVDYRLADGKGSPYAATMLGNLKNWLDDDPEVSRVVEKVPSLDRNKILSK